MIPDNGGYAIAAYTAAALVYVTYAVILTVRERALRAKLARLDEVKSR